MILYMISWSFHALQPTIHPPAQRAIATDDDHDPDRQMDFDEESDFADQGPLTDMDMKEDAEMLSHLTIPYCFKGDQRIGHASTDTVRHAAGPGQRQQALRGDPQIIRRKYRQPILPIC